MSSYRKLPTSESPSLEAMVMKSDDDFTLQRRKTAQLASLLPRLALVVCALCTIVNVFLAVHGQPGVLAASPNAPLRREDIARLRRPSQFIRFDEIHRPSPPLPRQFDNHPVLIAQVDTSDPRRVFGEMTRRYMAHTGTITPEDRRVLVTQTISTIVQLRAIDYGMGICELRLTIPPSIAPAGGSGLLDEAQSRPLSIYRLNSTIALDARTLSASSKPPRIARVAEVALHRENDTDGLVWHRRFACGEEEMLTFELTCGTTSRDESCDVEWWQDRENPNPAIFMTQYSTV